MRKYVGFTLMELLVALAILALLTAVLFPVFARARLAVRKPNDLSSLKQVECAINLYAQDYDDALPLQNSAVRTASFSAGRAPEASPFATGCLTEAADGSWQSLNGGCQDTVSN